MSVRSGDSMYSLQRDRSQLQREVTRLADIIAEERNRAQVVLSQKGILEHERDEAVAARDEAYRWALAAVRVAEREVERLTERYVGNREDCGHLKCFTRAPGLLVEACEVCESADVRAQIKAVRELREAMIACPNCPQPACRVHYDQFGEVYTAIMKEMRW